MIEELQVINHWLSSKEPFFLRKYGLDKSYFVATKDVVDWIETFRSDMKGHLPQPDTVASKFEDFRKLSDLDTMDYLTGVLREQRAYMDYRPVLTNNAQMVNSGQTLEAMWKMKSDIDNLLKKYTGSLSRYDWIQHAKDRYERYMEKHNNEGLNGLSTGIKGLDDLTGGWKPDDFILLAGRTNEGKSLVGLYLSYMVWRSLMKAKMKDPVVYISTEMPEVEVAYRLDTMKAHFSNRGLNEGGLQDPELYKEYLNDLSTKENSFFIMTQDANRGNPFTPTDIRAIIDELRPAFVVVDQLYDLSDGTGETDIRRKIVNVTRELRDANLYTQTPMMVIAQAGRESAREAKKDKNASPELHHIQESDNPAQKATKALTLRKIDDVFKMSLKKNRSGEKDKDIFMRSNIDTGIWDEISENEMVF